MNTSPGLTLMGVFHMSELNMLLLDASGSFTLGAGAAAGFSAAAGSSAAGLLKLKPPHLGTLGAWGGGVRAGGLRGWVGVWQVRYCTGSVLEHVENPILASLVWRPRQLHSLVTCSCSSLDGRVCELKIPTSVG
jgi:hypothetical protein